MELMRSYLFGFLCIFLSPNEIKSESFEEIEDVLKPLFKTAAAHFSEHQIVKPEIYKDGKKIKTTRNKDGHLDAFTLKFETNQRHLTLELLRNKNLFSKSYIEKTYIDGDRFKLKRPLHRKLQKHCFYHGHIKGVEHSVVALSTCDGISGYIQNGKDVYHMEPAFDIDSESHRLYQDVHSVNTHTHCGAHDLGHSSSSNVTRQIKHKNQVLHRMKRNIVRPYDANSNTRYVEMYVVNDMRTFDSNGRNEVMQTRKTQNIINIVSRLYQPFNVYIALVGIENWTQQDMFTITSEADTTLENFLHYRKSRINPYHPNDNAQLITDTSFGNGVVGKAIKGTICTFQFSGGVNLNLATEGQTATTIAHELGHNFGMDHDNYSICECKEEKCIMAATSGGSRNTRINTPTHWSSCSFAALQEAFEMGMDYCLLNIPEKLYEGPVCGNGFTEEGEECDCGLPEDCKTKCCNASTCKLTSGSQCASGICCDVSSCKHKAAATLCRGSVGDCDLPEFCWGNSPHCPADVFLQDGVECDTGNSQSYCYKGRCKTHTGQCRLLWGSTGRVSDPVCFKHLNSNGSKHGNCGYNWTTERYEPCQRDDVMCGLLHCVHQNEKLMFWKDNLALDTPATFLTIGSSTYVCRGAILDVGLDMPDPGMVPDGAKCDTRKMCIDHKCRAISELKFPSCPDGCSDKGVCNSKGNCHCDEGFGGPDCDASGNGGSIDSGPIKVSEDKSVMVGLLIFFFVVVPFLAVMAFLIFYFRVTILGWWHKKVHRKHKNQSRPVRPSRPPPKKDSPTKSPPLRPPAVDPKPQPVSKPQSPQPVSKPQTVFKPLPPPKKNGSAVAVSDPVLTSTTHTDTKSQVKPSPVAVHKPPPPKPPIKPQTEDQSVDDTKTPPAESKPRFGINIKIPKIPSFSKSDRQGAQSPKIEKQRQEEAPVADIVKKRNLTRNISNPVLISTTDRRSKHLVKIESVNAAPPPPEVSSTSVPPPPLPPKVSLNKVEYENTNTIRRNKPLPPRPMSMPESECGEDLGMTGRVTRKSTVDAPSRSPRMPERPPPPPQKPDVDNTRKMLEDELAKLDHIHIEIPRDSPERQLVKPQNNTQSVQSTADKPKENKPKELKPKLPAAVSKSSDSTKKPLQVPRMTANKTKSDSKLSSTKVEDKEKPVFNPKARPGLAGKKPGDKKKSGSSKTETQSENLIPPAAVRKPSTESLDDDPEAGSASVAGLTQRFEVQKKPLLSDRNIKRTQSQGVSKVPLAPPKPKSGVKQIRSVDV